MRRLLLILMAGMMLVGLIAGAAVPVNVREHTQKVTSYLRQMPRAQRVPYPEYREGAKFVDAQGKVHGIAEVRAAANERGKAWRTWWPGVKLNMHRAGQDAILAPFKAEIKAMKEEANK